MKVALDSRDLNIAAQYSPLQNPWAAIETFACFEAGDADAAIRDAYRHFGIVKIRGVYSREEVAHFRAIFQEISGIDDASFLQVAKGRQPNYVRPGVIGYDPRLWPLADTPRIIQALRHILEEPFGLINNSLAVSFSAWSLHRDGDIFHLDDSPHNLISDHRHTIPQVLTCFNPPGRPGSRLYFAPFTHSKKIYDEQAARIGLDIPFTFYDDHEKLKRQSIETGDDRALREMERYCVSVECDPGDLFLFDGRLMHRGDQLTGPKYITVMTYGQEDPVLLRRMRKSVLANRPDGNADLPPDFLEYLESRGLMLPGLAELARLKWRQCASLNQLDRSRPIYIYGAGKAGREIRNRLSELGFSTVRGFIDSFEGGTLDGLPKHAFGEYRKIHTPDALVLIASQYLDDIMANLEEAGIEGINVLGLAGSGV